MRSGNCGGDGISRDHMPENTGAGIQEGKISYRDGEWCHLPEMNSAWNVNNAAVANQKIAS